MGKLGICLQLIKQENSHNSHTQYVSEIKCFLSCLDMWVKPVNVVVRYITTAVRLVSTQSQTLTTT